MAGIILVISGYFRAKKPYRAGARTGDLRLYHRDRECDCDQPVERPAWPESRASARPIVQKLHTLWRARDSFNARAFAIGLASMALIVLLRLAPPKLPG